MTLVEKLLAVSSEPLCDPPEVGPAFLAEGPRLCRELSQMLQQRNGFYAFESALHVFPVSCVPASGVDLETWNSGILWRGEYKGFVEGLLFFAEDVFQDQFCIAQKGILRFKAETGETIFMADSLERWADLILSDYKYQTGWTLASQWQAENGPLPPGKRLMPKTPFFLGGEYAVENLWAGDAVEGMRFKADLAMQTRNLPGGTKVRLKIDKRT